MLVLGLVELGMESGRQSRQKHPSTSILGCNLCLGLALRLELLEKEVLVSVLYLEMLKKVGKQADRPNYAKKPM